MHTAKMHHNSWMGCPINFILGGWHKGSPASSGAQTGCHGAAGGL